MSFVAGNPLQEKENLSTLNLEGNSIEGNNTASTNSNREGAVEGEEENTVQTRLNEENEEVLEPLAKKVKLDNGSAPGNAKTWQTAYFSKFQRAVVSASPLINFHPKSML